MGFSIKLSVILILCSLSQSLAFSTFECGGFTRNVCIVDNITLTPEDPDFELTRDDPEEVETVGITDSSIPLLWLVSVCEKFPNLRYIFVINSGVKELLEDTFKGCNQLQSISLEQNKFTTLPQNLFKNLKLRTIELKQNSLTHLPDDIFQLNDVYYLADITISESPIVELPTGLFGNLPALSVINLSGNRLREIPYDALYTGGPVTSLNVAANDITSIDIDKFFKIFRFVETFNFNGNFLRCEQHIDILDRLSVERVSTSTSAPFRRRFVEVQNLGGGLCLAEVEWAAVHYAQTVDRS